MTRSWAGEREAKVASKSTRSMPITTRYCANRTCSIVSKVLAARLRPRSATWSDQPLDGTTADAANAVPTY